MTDPRFRKATYASPPCIAHEIDPAYFDPLAVDPQQAMDLVRWRKGERMRLLAERAALPVTVREKGARAIAGHLDAVLARHFGDLTGRIVSGYWPFKAEFDLRFWMERLHAAGAHLALPVVENRAAPLVFRAWAPETVMVCGHWNILVPAADSPHVEPDIMLAPLVGWDGEGYRLGCGGGHFDRTLAATIPRPLVIGVGLHSARVATIFPQPHDIAMDAIVTEFCPQWLGRA